MKKIRIALAQINPIVGDLQGNVKKIISYIKNARALKAEIIAFPELAVTGYPPEDLVLKPQFIKDNIDALNEVITASDGITAIVGFIERDNSLFNAAAVISNRRLIMHKYKGRKKRNKFSDRDRFFS